MTPSPRRLPTFFLSHGGGPWPYMSGEFRKAFVKLESSLQELPRQLGETPSAILVVSGHWEEIDFAIMSSPAPPMVYDYYGFPEETYKVRYPAPGSPELAARVQALLASVGLPCHEDSGRGFDHGTFAPLAVAYPEANVPVIQVSMKQGYDPAAHLALGRALSPLRDQGVLIIGSGLSYHNLRRFDSSAKAPSSEFDAWLRETLLESSPDERTRRLLQWDKAPSARAAHPREDHLIPLMVAVGAAESEKADLVYHEEDFFGGITASSFRFGGDLIL